MALNSRQKAANRKDMACGKRPRHFDGSLVTIDTGTVDATYGAPEQGVVTSLRTQLDAVQAVLAGLFNRTVA